MIETRPNTTGRRSCDSTWNPSRRQEQVGAPDACHPPGRRRVSAKAWLPGKGVLLTGENLARYREGGQVVEIPGEELFDHYWPVEIQGLGEFEGYRNRDSLALGLTFRASGRGLL